MNSDPPRSSPAYLRPRPALVPGLGTRAPPRPYLLLSLTLYVLPNHPLALFLTRSRTQQATRVRETDIPLAMPSEAALDAWTRRIINSVPVEIYHVNRPGINAPDVESAARVLLFLIEWQFTHNVQSATRAAQDAFRQALTDSCGPANTCSLTTHYMLLRNARTLGIRVYVLCSTSGSLLAADVPCSGAGLGAGVQRSVLRAAVDIVVHDEACWQEMGRYYIPTIHLDGVTTVSARIAKMKTAGFLSMLHLLAGLGGPHPISPFLLLLAIVGRERACLVDAPLWRVLDVELYERFRPWWEYDGMSAVPVSDPRIFGLLTAASYDVSSFVALH